MCDFIFMQLPLTCLISNYKFIFFISADGNFCLRHKNKKGDPDGIAHNEESGYCIDVNPYKAYFWAIHGSGDCDDVCV